MAEEKNYHSIGRIWGQTITSVMAAFVFGYSMSELNPISILYKYQHGWSDSMNTLISALITAAFPCGAFFGAFLGGKTFLYFIFNSISCLFKSIGSEDEHDLLRPHGANRNHVYNVGTLCFGNYRESGCRCYSGN